MSGDLKMKALFFVGLQIVAIFAILTTVAVAPVKGAGLPATINGDWVVSDHQEYWGGTCDIMAGNLIIKSGGVLKLHRATLNMNPDYNINTNWISVEQNGELVMEDSLIQSGNGNRYNWSFDFGAKGTIKNSNITDVGDWNSGGYINILSTGVTFDGNDISNGDMGLIIGDPTTPVAPLIVNNTLHDLDSIAVETVNSAATLTGNTIKNCNSGGQAFSAILILGVATNFRNNTLSNNGNGGVTVAGFSKQEIWDSTFNNAAKDIIIEAIDAFQGTPTPTGVDTYNTVYQSVALNTLIAQGNPEGKATMQPFWNIDIQVKRQSTGRLVPGANVGIDGAEGTKLKTGLLTGADGMVHSLWVPPSKTETTGANNDQTKVNDYAPHSVWASTDISGRIVKSNTTVAIDHSGMLINVTIDDLPPFLVVNSPVSGFLTNDTGVDITGRTDPTASLTIGGSQVQVTQTGDFTKYLGLLEGKNDIPVVAMDASGNTAQVDLMVYRDTKTPVVKISSPANGTTVGNPDPYVSGNAEPGSLLTINGKIVPVSADKSFNTTIHLTEGQNTITAIDRDKVGNTGTDSVTVMLDSTPPTLIIVEPSDNKRTKDMNLTIKGITESNALLTINGNIVAFSGISFQYVVLLKEGPNDIIIMVSDSVGNTLTRVLTVYLDTTPPTVTVTAPKVDGYTTNQDAVVVTGTTEPGATVKVNDQIADNVAGAFSKEVKLGASQNKITVVVTDSVGNAVSKEFFVSKDTIPPELTVQSPKDGAVVNAQSLGKVEVRGKTEPGATVYVNGERAGLAGISFQAYVWLAQGNNTIDVVAYDEAGNMEPVTLSVTYDNGVEAQVLTPVNELNTSADTIVATGFVEPGATVKINDKTATVTAQGGFSENVALVPGRNTLTFIMTDKAGNQLIITRYVNVAGGGKRPSSSAMPLNLLFLVLIVVFVVAIVAVLMSGRPKKERPAVYNPSAEPPPPSFAGGAPPPPNFGSGGMLPPPGYGYAQPQPYQQDPYAQGNMEQVYDGTATAVAEQPVPEATATEVAPETIETQPESIEAQVEEEDMTPKKAAFPEDIEEEEDMTPKKAPMPEDAPQAALKYSDMTSEKDVAKDEGAWARKSGKPKDALDEILDDEKENK
jgi:hypothetical protein